MSRILPFLTVVVTLVLGCGFGSSSQAQSIIADPIKDYLNVDDLGTSIAVKNSAELLKLTLDVDAIGKPWILLSLPLNYVKGGGFSWAVYVPVEGGYTKTLPLKENEPLTCYPDRIYVGPITELAGQRGIVTYEISHGSGDIHAYWIKNNVLVNQSIAVFKLQDEGGNTDGTITNVPSLLTYFPELAKPNPKGTYTVERTSFDDLRKRGYNLPVEH